MRVHARRVLARPAGAQLLVAAAAIASAPFALAAMSGDTSLAGIEPLALHLPAAGLMAVTAWRARRARSSERLGVALLGMAAAFWAAAALLNDGRPVHPFTSDIGLEATLFLYSGYFLAVGAVVTLAPGPGLLDAERTLGIVSVAVAVSAVAVEYVFLGPARDGGTWTTATALPLLDMAILGTVTVSLLGELQGPRLRTIFLLGAASVLVTGDLLGPLRGSVPAENPGMLEGARLAAAWLFAMAVATDERAAIEIDPRNHRMLALAQSAFPFVLIAPLAVLTTAHTLRGDAAPVLTVGTFAAATLLLARQWLLTVDTRGLNAHRERLLTSLNAKTRELEREVLERRRAEGALRRSEERFRAVAEHLDEGLLLAAADGRVVYANPTMAFLAGYGRAEFVGRRAIEVLQPWDYWASVLASPGEAQDPGPRRFEIPGIDYDGRPVWIEAYARTLSEDGDDAPGTVVIALDVTDRRQAAFEARDRADQLSRHNAALERLSSSKAFSSGGLQGAAQEIAEVALATIDIDAASLWLLDPEDATLSRISEARSDGLTADTPQRIHRRDYPLYFGALGDDRPLTAPDAPSDPRFRDLAVAVGMVSVVDVPIRILGRTAGVIRCERSDPAVPWSDQELALLSSMAGTAATVIEAEKREDALLGAARLAAVLGATPDLVAIWDAAGQAIYVNGPARTVLGIAHDDDASGVRLESFHPPDVVRDLHRLALPVALTTGHWAGETSVVTADGGSIPVSQVILAHDEGKEARYIATIMRDLSEARRAADERERLARKLQDAQKLESLGLLAGGIAHDFNNLLQAILGNAQVARMATPPDAGDSQEALADLEVAAVRAGDLVRQLLAFAGGGRTGIEPTDPSELVEETVRLLLAMVTKHATLEMDLAPDLPRVEADPVQVRQVVMNLVTNAADAIGESGGKVHVRTSVVDADENVLRECFLGETLTPGRYVAIEVQDDGVGMDSGTLARIFDPFFTTKSYGHGLGLAAVLGIVRSHGGALRVVSRPAAGTTFTILLPPLTRAVDARPRSEQAAA